MEPRNFRQSSAKRLRKSSLGEFVDEFGCTARSAPLIEKSGAERKPDAEVPWAWRMGESPSPEPTLHTKGQVNVSGLLVRRWSQSPCTVDQSESADH